jgi:hypothetical protein
MKGQRKGAQENESQGRHRKTSQMFDQGMKGWLMSKNSSGIASSRKLIDSLQDLKFRIEINGLTESTSAEKRVLDQILAIANTTIHYQSLEGKISKIDFLEGSERFSTEEIEATQQAEIISKEIDKLLREKRKSKKHN